MNELIKIEERNGEQLVSARELHKFLEVKTRFDKWFNRMVEYGFIENIDYILVAQKRATKNPRNPYTEFNDYLLKISMAKELSMIQRNGKGKQARLYFIECERKAKEQNQIIISKPLINELMDRLKETEIRLNRLENIKTSIKSNPKMMSISEYALNKGVKIDSQHMGGIGTKAKNTSKKLGYEVGKAYSSNEATKNIYNVEILEHISFEFLKRKGQTIININVNKN